MEKFNVYRMSRSLRVLIRQSVDISFLLFSGMFSCLTMGYFVVGIFDTTYISLMMFAIAVFVFTLVLVIIGKSVRSHYGVIANVSSKQVKSIWKDIKVLISACSLSFFILLYINAHVFSVLHFSGSFAPDHIVEFFSQNFLGMMLGVTVCALPILYFIKKNMEGGAEQVTIIEKNAGATILVFIISVVLIGHAVYLLSNDNNQIFELAMSFVFGTTLSVWNFFTIFPIQLVKNN